MVCWSGAGQFFRGRSALPVMVVTFNTLYRPGFHFLLIADVGYQLAVNGISGECSNR
jgi:hypothetical protein